MTGRFSRRRLLGWSGAGAALAGVGAVSGFAAGSSAPQRRPDVVPFRAA
jgi:deferrochelatase/peroxidase EfeB